MRALIFGLILIFTTLSLASAETVRLKTGKIVEGEVVEKTGAYVKLDNGETVFKIPFKMMDAESGARLKAYDPIENPEVVKPIDKGAPSAQTVRETVEEQVFWDVELLKDEDKKPISEQKAECEAGDAYACSQVGSAAKKQRDLTEALVYYKKACIELKDCFSCSHYGKLQKDKQVLEQMLAPWFLGCEAGNSVDCLCAGETTYYSGKKSAGIKLLEKCCDMGDKNCCINLATWEHLENNKEKSNDASRRACELRSAIGCRDYAGKDSDSTREERIKLGFVNECSDGDPESCQLAGAFEQLAGTKQRAFDYFAKACGLGDESGCFWAGHVSKDLGDFETAKGYYLKLCEKGEGGGCFNLALVLEKEGRVKEADQWFRKAIELKPQFRGQYKYFVDRIRQKRKNSALRSTGVSKAEKFMNVDGIRKQSPVDTETKNKEGAMSLSNLVEPEEGSFEAEIKKIVKEDLIRRKKCSSGQVTIDKLIITKIGDTETVKFNRKSFTGRPVYADFRITCQEGNLTSHWNGDSKGPAAWIRKGKSGYETFTPLKGEMEKMERKMESFMAGVEKKIADDMTESLKKEYDRIDFSDGIDRREATTIAKVSCQKDLACKNDFLISMSYEQISTNWAEHHLLKPIMDAHPDQWIIWAKQRDFGLSQVVGVFRIDKKTGESSGFEVIRIDTTDGINEGEAILIARGYCRDKDACNTRFMDKGYWPFIFQDVYVDETRAILEPMVNKYQDQWILACGPVFPGAPPEMPLGIFHVDKKTGDVRFEIKD